MPRPGRFFFVRLWAASPARSWICCAKASPGCMSSISAFPPTIISAKASACRRMRLLFVPLAGRAAAGRRGAGGAGPALQRNCRSDRGQCAAWRPHVLARFPVAHFHHRYLQRRRRIAGHGSRLQPAGRGSLFLAGPLVPLAPRRSARLRHGRRRRGHRRRLQRAAGGRLLRLRADPGQLHHQGAGAGGRGHGFAPR